MKKIIAYLLLLSMLLLTLAGCGASSGSAETGGTDTAQSQAEENTKLDAPKYVFLFIGDGMSYPQIQVTADYLGALEDENYSALTNGSATDGAALAGPKYLNFMNFEAAGSAINYDSSSFIPDSASSATAIASGHKTYSSSINVDETGTVEYETIAEKLHSQLGMKIGIVTSVGINHATPAAFYGKSVSRDDYDNLGSDLIASGFEYFAGACWLGSDLTADAEAAGYNVVNTIADAEALTADDGKMIVFSEHVASDEAIPYEIDRTDDMWALSDYVEKGIEVLDNDKGFFMMCEGGKIDWTGHANDGATALHEVIALSDAVRVAIDFAAEHPDETLIIVTGDHETGGLSIGFAGTDSDTYLNILENQKISFEKFDNEYIPVYQENQTSFDEIMKDVEELFGFTSGTGSTLDLTVHEVIKITEAASLTLADESLDEDSEYLLYGDYEPLTVAITEILNNKAGISYTSWDHTALPVAVFADGVGADMFNGYYDSTNIFNKLADIMNVE